MKLGQIIVAGVLVFLGYKVYQRFSKPSSSEIQSLSKSLSKVICNPKIAQITNSYAQAVATQTKALAEGLKNQRSTASLLQAGVETAAALRQKTLEYAPSIRVTADPIFTSDGWTSSKISSLLKVMNHNAKTIVQSSVRHASTICGSEESFKSAAVSAELVLRTYVTN